MTAFLEDDFSPRYTGDLANPLIITLADHQGTVYPLGGLSLTTDLTLTLIPASGGVTVVGSGWWDFYTDGSDGMLKYEWAPADVTNAGLFAIRLGARMGSNWLHFDAKFIEFLDPRLPA